MAKQSQKSIDNNTEILHALNKYTQILRSRRKRVEMLFKRRVLRLLLKFSNKGLPLILLPPSLTFREFYKVAATMANVLTSY